MILLDDDYDKYLSKKDNKRKDLKHYNSKKKKYNSDDASSEKGKENKYHKKGHKNSGKNYLNGKKRRKHSNSYI